MQLINEVLADGVRCLSLPDSRFKTSRLTAVLLLPLRRETASACALVPYLLRRSCAAYPDYTALQRRLNELYGATISAEVARIEMCIRDRMYSVSLKNRESASAYAQKAFSFRQPCFLSPKTKKRRRNRRSGGG